MSSLFTELKLNCGAILKNRIVMTIESAFFDGNVTQEMIDYYQARSGDVAAIIVECAFVENYGRGFPGALGIDNDNKIEGLQKLAQAIQSKGSKAILQIYHTAKNVYKKSILLHNDIIRFNYLCNRILNGD